MSAEPKDTQHNGKDAILYQLEGRPPLLTAIPLGLQHILAMFTGNLAPILIVALFASDLQPDQLTMMIQCAMLISGLATFLQLYPIKFRKLGFQLGAGLPIVMGTSFAFVPVMKDMAVQYGAGGILGACLIAGFVVWPIGFFYKYIKNIFTPLVIGAILVTIGVSLLETGANYYAGGVGSKDYGSFQNIMLGTAVLATITLIQRFGKGMLKNIAILIGLVVGYALAMMMGKVNVAEITNAAVLSLPQPFYVTPTFHADAIVSLIAIYIVVTLETMGNTSTITVAAFNREANARETSGSILANALASQVAAIFNAFPSTAFGQNAGIVAMNKIINKFCIATGAAFLVIAAFCPKLATVFSNMPPSVLGGAVITIFAMIMLNGMKLISLAGFTPKNMLILGLTFGVGYGLGAIGGSLNIAVENYPVWSQWFLSIVNIVFGNQVSAVFVVSVLATLAFTTSKERAEMGGKH